MSDGQIHASIEQLVAEEHEPWWRESDGTRNRPRASAASRNQGPSRSELGLAAPAARTLRRRKESGRRPSAPRAGHPELLAVAAAV